MIPPFELVNLSIFAILHLNQIKDLVGAKIAKTGNIHILFVWQPPCVGASGGA
jgi:hypothetical protein